MTKLKICRIFKLFFEHYGRCNDQWQNVKFAEKAWFLVLRSAIPTEEQTEPGSRTEERLRQWLTEHRRPLMFAPDAFVPTR